jgi:hypothetical protein
VALSVVQANAAAAGVDPSADVLDAIDNALGDAPVKGQTLAALATGASDTGPDHSAGP